MNKYTKEEIRNFKDDTEIEWDRLPFWTKIEWIVFGPPGGTGPR